MKRVFFTLMFMLTFPYATIAAPLELFLSDSDTGSLITLGQTTVAVIELDSNPSTGHSWRAKPPLGQHFRIVGRTFESSQPGLRGAGGKEKIYVVGKTKGRSQLVLDYRRRHDPTISNTITYKFNTLAKFNETFSLPVQVSTIPPQRVQNQATSNLGLPIAFNWCDQNGCTPIRDQGNCGSC
jgi:inhibitor of cysteine peptidase